jgi:hypothetical protein
MKRTTLLALMAAFTMVVGALPALPHHSFSGEFDANKPVKLTGTVTKIEWMNPHAYFFIDVKDEQSGAVTNWAVELGSPNGLTRLGWTRNSMKIGDMVMIEGSMGRNKPNLANARSVTLSSTGQKLGAASSESYQK